MYCLYLFIVIIIILYYPRIVGYMYTVLYWLCVLDFVR